jgi:hypothetical protein
MTTSDRSTEPRSDRSTVPTSETPAQPTSETTAEPTSGTSAMFDLSRPVWEPDDPQFEARVLRAFVRGGRLTSIPARERKKRVILRWLVDQVLPDDAPVDERELNMRIALLNPDASALRRYLVDARLAAREGMVYRRGVPLNAPAAEG